MAGNFPKGGNGGGSLPGRGVPGSQENAFYRTSDALFPDSPVPSAGAEANVTGNPLIGELKGSYAAQYGDVSGAQVYAVPPNSLAPYAGETTGSTVSIRNDLFSRFGLPESTRIVGHEFTHVLNPGGFAGIGYGVQNILHGYYNNPYEVRADAVGVQFAAAFAGRAPLIVPPYGLRPGGLLHWLGAE